ncbi:MAG TPA: hypothetical protein VFT80_04550 [Actinomycetota bacterium]|nr:hypothetical protein [Actinomycetota bacterium]
MRVPIARALALTVATTWMVAGGLPTASGGVPEAPTLIQIIDTSSFSPPSPDPAGMAVLRGGRLLMSDCEVDETPWFQGKTVFRFGPDGDLLSTFKTTRFSIEPTGLEVRKKTLIVSDDDRDRIFFVRKGKDHKWGTRDDKVRSFATRPFGSRDPEGIALGGGFLFIADGAKAEVFRLKPGPNGIFDGVAPAGDDRVRRSDTKTLGQPDPEGIEYRPSSGTVFLVSNRRNSDITEVTIRGRLVATYDTAGFGLHSPAGLAWAPGSTGPNVKHLWIADRGVDNAADPDENDGRVFEVAL